MARQNRAIDIGHIGAQDQRRLMPPRQRLENRGMPDGQLNRIRRSFDQSGDGFLDAFDAGQEAVFVEKAVIDGDIETAVGDRVEKAFESEGFQESVKLRRNSLKIDCDFL